MPSIKLREDEPFDVALRRFKRACDRAGVIVEARRRGYYEKPTTARKRRAAAAVKRHLRKVARDIRRPDRKQRVTRSAPARKQSRSPL